MFYKRLRPIVLFLMFIFFIACVSSGIKTVPLSQELPSELAAELKKKFEVKEASEQAASAGVSQDPHLNKQNKVQQKVINKKSKHAGKVVYPYRRPAKDPIWVAERLSFTISYFGVTAGVFNLEVMPHKLIDNRKVYHVRGHAISSALFGLFYSLNDTVESYFDFDGLFSHRFHVILDETKQKRDSLELNDSEKKQTFFWNRWHHKEKGYTEVKTFSPIQPFSQDTLSALYYLRTQPLPDGAVVTVPVVSEGKSWEAVCTVLRREMKKTAMGNIQTIVIQPETKYEGVLKKTGDSYLWLSDDDRRIPIRLEAKVRVGTVVANLKAVELGTPPVASALESATENLEQVKKVN